MENSIDRTLYSSLLKDIAQKSTATDIQDVVRELTLWDILKSSGRTTTSDAGATSGNWTGLFSEADMINYGMPTRTELAPTTELLLEDELDAVMISISDFFHADNTELSKAERMERAHSLPENIQSQKDAMARHSSDVTAAYERIETLVAEISETHARLGEDLKNFLSTFPDPISRRRSATNDLLAATIETSLIKLSLIRARAHQALYGHRSPTIPEATMAKALSAAHAKLQRDERKLAEEGQRLDREIQEYEAMLRLVDGAGGGFAQVVEDWTRVQKEKEECKRDLRRLGWTGD